MKSPRRDSVEAEEKRLYNLSMSSMECVVPHDPDPVPLPEQESQMWERRLTDPGDTEAYHWLFRRHFGLVINTAMRFLKKGLPPRVTRADLISDGSIGLCEAIGNFQPETGNTFPTFAVWRIHGEIVDSLRRIDPLARTMRRRVTRLQRGRRELSQELQRAPSMEELQQYLELDAEQFLHCSMLERFAEPADIDGVMPVGDRLSAPCAEILEAQQQPPEQYFYEHHLEFWRVMLRGMNVREKLLLILHYREGLDLYQIATLFGVTAGAITQQHRQILDRLHKRCSEHRDLEDELSAIFRQCAVESDGEEDSLDLSPQS